MPYRERFVRRHWQVKDVRVREFFKLISGMSGQTAKTLVRAGSMLNTSIRIE